MIEKNLQSSNKRIINVSESWLNHCSVRWTYMKLKKWFSMNQNLNLRLKQLPQKEKLKSQYPSLHFDRENVLQSSELITLNMFYKLNVAKSK